MSESQLNTAFHPIDREHWDRNAYFYYFTEMLPTGFSLTVELDITKTYDAIKARDLKFFPAYLYLTTKTIACQEWARTAWQGETLGQYEVLHPSYAIVHEDDGTMSNMWTEYDDSFKRFYDNYQEDMARYQDCHGILAKPTEPPANALMVGMVPWIAFTHYAPVPFAKMTTYQPIIQAGKYKVVEGKRLMPFSITVHHAVADGRHVAELLDDLQKALDNPAAWIDR